MLDKSHPAVAALVAAVSSDGSWDTFVLEFQDLALFVAPLASTLPAGLRYVCNAEDPDMVGWVSVPEPSVTWQHENGYGDCCLAVRADQVGILGSYAGSEGASAPGFTITPVS